MATAYEVGWARREILIEPRGYAMSGYGMWHHRARAAWSPLYARAIAVRDPGGRAVTLCCVDLAMVTHALREAAGNGLVARLGPDHWDEGFVLMATHSHSTPGGCGHEALYNFVTPGFVPAHLAAVTNAVVDAVEAAVATAAPATLGLSRGAFTEDDEVAWNRSLPAYVRNPEVAPVPADACHLALDRTMAVLGVRRDGELRALLSLFGVHATCIGNDNDAHDGDNKGYAARALERALEVRGGRGDGVAVFAQATAGDVSPHYHGPGQRRRRRAVRRSGDQAYARANGERQARLALEVADGGGPTLSGPIDAVMAYRDFTAIAVPADHGGGDGAQTTEPCHGPAFFAGTPVDGPGAPGPVSWLARRLSRALRRRRLRGRRLDETERAHYRALYEAQGAKDVVLEAGRKLALGRPLADALLPDAVDPTVAEMKREARAGALEDSPLVPTVLPVQVVRIGEAALVCCPGELTTVAGGRLVGAVGAALEGTGVEEVVLVTYCNDYMGYVTTPEEYDAQRYEGGHTVFGRWTLGAFRSVATELAAQLRVAPGDRTHDPARRPPPVPEDELALRSDLAPPGGG